MANADGPGSDVADLALSEASYVVTGTGEIVSQRRYVPLTAMVRLTTRIAQKLASDLTIDEGR